MKSLSKICRFIVGMSIAIATLVSLWFLACSYWGISPHELEDLVSLLGMLTSEFLGLAILTATLTWIILLIYSIDRKLRKYLTRRERTKEIDEVYG